MKKIFIAGVLFLFLGGITERGSAEVANRIVAIVNNEIITAHELDKFMKIHPPSEQAKGNQEEVQKQILFQLIDQKLTEEQVKRLGIQISKDDLDKALSRLRAEQGLTNPEHFSAALARGGLTEADLRKRLMEQLQRVRLMSREIGSRIVVPEQKLKEYFENNKTKFQRKEGVRLGEIILLYPEKASQGERDKLKEKAQGIWDRLKKGENFPELARMFSQGFSAAQGGDMGLFGWKELDPTLRETISKMKPGEFSQVLPYPQGWQIIKVIAIQDNRPVTLEDVKDEIHEKLFQEEAERRFDQWVKQLRNKAIIQVMF
jgi:peptidyl-prolyl cis-trans isomerase SurA